MSLHVLKLKLAAALCAAGLSLSTGSAGAQAHPQVQQRFGLCTACHGDAGVSSQSLTPSLAGQPSFYAITQLFLFREGRRNNEAMTAVAKGMTDDDLRAFSDFIGKLPPPPAPSAGAADEQRMARGAELARQHRCASCHGTGFEGGKQVARLAHQREDYLTQTLKEFRSGQRVGYTQAMNEALTSIAPEDLQDLAHYLTHLPASRP